MKSKNNEVIKSLSELAYYMVDVLQVKILEVSMPNSTMSRWYIVNSFDKGEYTDSFIVGYDITDFMNISRVNRTGMSIQVELLAYIEDRKSRNLRFSRNFYYFLYS